MSCYSTAGLTHNYSCTNRCLYPNSDTNRSSYPCPLYHSSRYGCWFRNRCYTSCSPSVASPSNRCFQISCSCSNSTKCRSFPDPWYSYSSHPDCWYLNPPLPIISPHRNIPCYSWSPSPLSMSYNHPDYSSDNCCRHQLLRNIPVYHARRFSPSKSCNLPGRSWYN